MVAHDAAAGLVDDVVEEGAQVVLGLEADHVVGAQRPDQGCMARQGGEDFHRRERGVQEEPHGPGYPRAAQLFTHRDEVVIVDPDQVLRIDQAYQFLGEDGVDLQIARVVLLTECRQVETVVEERPKGTIGETVVIFIVVFAR